MAILGNPERLPEAVKFIQKGAFKPKIDRKFSLDEIVEAHKYMEKNTQFGKIVGKSGLAFRVKNALSIQ